MNSHLFRKGRWVIDLNDKDSYDHLGEIGFTQDILLIMKYFIFLLYVDTSKMGLNEFSERHDEIKDAIIAVMSQKLSVAARQLSAVTEGIVNKSLLNDGCIISLKPYPKWTGTFHEYEEPKNFYQLLEGALRDPRSRIGRVIDYPPSEEIFHVSEMIRNPLAHGVVSAGTLEDYKVLFFLLILLYHDIVNPHQYAGNHKYLKWADRIDLRLAGEEPTNEKIENLAVNVGLDVNELRKNLT
jgi:hypothetical protein